MDIGVEGDQKNSEREGINMTDKLICPDDGRECIYSKQQEEGCWNCPKIQELLRKTEEVCWDGGEEIQW